MEAKVSQFLGLRRGKMCYVTFFWYMGNTTKLGLSLCFLCFFCLGVFNTTKLGLSLCFLCFFCLGVFNTKLGLSLWFLCFFLPWNI